MNKKILLMIFLLLIYVINSFSSLIRLGNKPLSLGNVYTAYNGDVYSLFTNPAGLYGDKMFDLKLDLLSNLNFTGNILYNINNIIENSDKFEKILQSQQEGTSIDIVQISSLLFAIKNLVEIDKPGKGMLVGINGGMSVKFKNFAFGVRNVTDIGLKPRVDTNFYLGSISTYSSNFAMNNISVLKFTETNNPSNAEGIVLTTSTLKYENLASVRDDLAENVLPWLINELEKMNVKVPQEIKDNLEGIANTLINLSVDNGASEKDVKNAVEQLKDPSLQKLISDILHKATTSATLEHNESGLTLKGVNYTELILGYSYSIFNNIHFGMSIKYLIGKTFYYNFKIFQKNRAIDFKDITDLENKLIRNSQAIGLDLGAIYKLPIPVVEVNLGLLVKNLIEPYFNLPNTDEKLKLPRQVKLGAMGSFKILKFGLDLDLNKAETFVEGYNIQNVALGVEVIPPIILPSLRLGYLKNLAYESDQIFSVGLGFKIFIVNFDLCCAFNSQKTRINKDFVLPTSNLFLGLSLGVEF